MLAFGVAALLLPSLDSYGGVPIAAALLSQAALAQLTAARIVLQHRRPTGPGRLPRVLTAARRSAGRRQGTRRSAR